MAYKCLEGMDIRCQLCGKPAQVHHIVKRAKAPFLVECIYNMAFLCLDHHTGEHGVHKNAELDRELKRQMQQELEFMFNKEYYTKEEIKDILGIKEVDQLCKTLTWYSEGYKKEDIVYRCMGGKNYL